MRRLRVSPGTHSGTNTTIGEVKNGAVKTVRSIRMWVPKIFGSVRRISGGSRGMAAGAAVSLALCAGAAVVGSAGLNTARALAQTGTGSAAVSTTSSATQPDQERAGIDALIDQLHDSLRITAEQESLWRGVTKVMRDNAETMSRLAQARAEHAQTATALDDLKSYAEISEAHAAGTRRMIPVFEGLYESMSPEQKRAADAEFRGHLQERAHQAE